MKKSTRKAKLPKVQFVNKSRATPEAQPLLQANSRSALALLSMIGQAQLSIEDLLGLLSRQFVEQLLMMAAESVAGPKHPGCRAGKVLRHGEQRGPVNLAGHLRTRPRLRVSAGEVTLPGYAKLAGNGEFSSRIADVLACNVSTRTYARVMYRCADAMGISRSAASRHFVRHSAQALSKLTAHESDHTDPVTIYVDGIIVVRHHLIAAVGVDPTRAKHILGLAPDTRKNTKVVNELMGGLTERGFDLNLPRLWVIDGSKALRSAIAHPVARPPTSSIAGFTRSTMSLSVCPRPMRISPAA